MWENNYYQPTVIKVHCFFSTNIMKFRLLFILSFCTSIALTAQTNNEYVAIDAKMLQIPDSSTKSTGSIARYVNSKFSTNHDKIRAIYYWITKNIQYDIKNKYAINLHEDTKGVADKLLKSQKGVCIDYAILFDNIVHQLGIKSHVILGFTKQNGALDNIPHAWCAASIGGIWYLLDPTWDAGAVIDSKYVSQQSNLFFKTKPEGFIKSHMPFDPQWQFLNYPVSYEEFCDLKAGSTFKKAYFNFNDSIDAYEKLSEEEQLVTTTGRIKKNKVTNSIVFDQLQYNKREIEYFENKKNADQYNVAINYYNEGINSLNTFINYRNKQFTPIKPDAELRVMLDTIDHCFTLAKAKMKLVGGRDTNTLTSLNQLYKSIEEASMNLEEQKIFLKKYLATGKLFRKASFYKFTLLGIPVK